jgi:diguanylate cyclase (GGDEF)-like protein
MLSVPPRRDADSTEARRLRAVRRFEVLDTPAEEQFDRLTRIVALSFDVPVALITIVDAERIWLKSKVGVDLSEIAREHGLCGIVLKEKQPVVVGDATQDPRTRGNSLVTGEFGLRSYCGVALRAHDGEAIGTVCALDRVERAFDERSIALLEEIAAVAVHELELRLALRHIKAESRLRRIAESQRARAERDARTDVLTGLRNRRALEFDLDLLERLPANKAPEGVVAVLDIDDLKSVNDARGHAAGDVYLRDVADELRAYFRGTDGLYRIGGDEFALVVRSAGLDVATVRERLEWVMERLRRAGHTAASASSGAAAFSATAGTPRNALQAADLLMYAEKRRKRMRAGQGGI